MIELRPTGDKVSKLTRRDEPSIKKESTQDTLSSRGKKALTSVDGS